MVENNINRKKTIGTAALLVSEAKQLPSQGERTVIRLTNTSTGGQIISLGIGEEAVNGNGIVLYPGGFHMESAETGFMATQDRILAISDNANATLAVYERVMQ